MRRYVAEFAFLAAWNIFFVLGCFSVAAPISGCTSRVDHPAYWRRPPYPASSVIVKVVWDFQDIKRVAPGSDLWPVTWGDDDHLYTAWGDGGGFGGTNSIGRVSLGVARMEGAVENLRFRNIFGGWSPTVPATFIGKPTGLLSIDGILYMGVVENDKWIRWKIGRSNDRGRSWVFNGAPFEIHWDFAETDGAFSDTTFLNFGKDYQGARDGYVYAYSQEGRGLDPVGATAKGIAMFRVPKKKIMNRNFYEYFAGVDENNRPNWTMDINRRKPVFVDPNGVGWAVRVDFNPGLGRYLLTTWHSWDGSWGIFDAPEPWGPWTTVGYYEKWIDSKPKFGFTFPQKWMSPDGKTMHLVFSGSDVYDSFNVIKATLTATVRDIKREAR